MHEQEMEKAFQVQESVEKQCAICMEYVVAKLNLSDRRFGILCETILLQCRYSSMQLLYTTWLCVCVCVCVCAADCEHCFCLGCIRKWRSAHNAKMTIRYSDSVSLRLNHHPPPPSEPALSVALSPTM